MNKILIICLLTLGCVPARAEGFEPYKIHMEGDGYISQHLFITFGIGAVNLNTLVANKIKNSISNSWSEISVDGSPIWFGKAEYAISPHHAAGIDFAYSGFKINAGLKDSLTKLNIPVSGQLTYKTWSLLARYNFHAFPESKFDLYAGVGMGFRSNTFKVKDNDPDKNWWNFPVDLKFVTKVIPSTLVLPTFGADLTLGCRYFIAPPVAVYAEFGLAKSIAQGGLAVRF